MLPGYGWAFGWCWWAGRTVASFEWVKWLPVLGVIQYRRGVKWGAEVCSSSLIFFRFAHVCFDWAEWGRLVIFHSSLCRQECDVITWLAGVAFKNHKFIRFMGNLATSCQFLDFLIVLGTV